MIFPQIYPLTLSQTGNWFIYLILCENQSLYCGITTQPAQRFDAHQNGTGARYTRMHKPLEIRIISCGLSRAFASSLENRIKKLTSHNKQQLWQQAFMLI